MPTPTTLSQAAAPSLQFGHFALFPSRRLLLAHGEPVDVGSRAFDLMLALTERPGELLRKDDLVKRVWPGLVVQENNLHVQVSALRRVLGVGAIATIPGQGYRFTLPLIAEGNAAAAIAVPRSASKPAEKDAAVGWRPVTMLRLSFVGGPVPNCRDADEAWYEFLMAFEAMAAELMDDHGGLLSGCDARGLTALFGLPATGENDLRNAVEAALALMEAVRMRRWPCLPGELAAIRGGLAHLNVIATPGPQRGTWRLSGSLDLVTSALCEHAAADELLVADEAHQLIAPYFRTRQWGPVCHADLSAPLAAHVVLGANGIETRLEAARVRGFSPLVGRVHDLRMLTQALNDTTAGQGRALCIVAEAGLGKSRLVTEFIRLLRPAHAKEIYGRCQQPLQMSAYAPFVQILRGLLPTLAADSAASFDDDLMTSLCTLDESLRHKMPAIRKLLAAGLDTGPAVAIEQAVSRAALNDALVAVISAAARHQTLVLVMDDWHWADEASEQALKILLPACARQRIMVIVTTRPQAAHSWPAAPHCAQWLLKPLDRDDCAAMIGPLCGARAVASTVGAFIHARTEGNPFFLEEVCRGLMDMGRLHVEEGVLKARGDLQDAELPHSVEAVIRARLDQLPTTVQDIARLASVLGREFAQDELEALSRDPGGCTAALVQLAEAGLIEPTQWVPRAHYRFRHALVQWVAHESLLSRQRRELHQRVAELLEASHGGRSDQVLDLLAYHSWHGTDARQAIDYALRAARQAAQRAAHAMAVDHLRHAVVLLEREPFGRSRNRQLLDAHALLGHHLILLQGFLGPDVLQVYERGIALITDERFGDERFSLTWMLWRYTYARARLTEAAALAAQLQQMAQRSGDEGRLLAAITAVGLIAFLRGDAQAAVADFDRALRHFEPGTERLLAREYGDSPAVFAWTFRGMALNVLGEFAAAQASLASARQLAESMDHPGSHTLALYYTGVFWTTHGRFAELQQSCEMLVNLCSRHDFVGIWMLAQVQKGIVMLAQGGLIAEQGLDWIAAHADKVIAGGYDIFRPVHHSLMAEYLAGMGRAPQARAELQRLRDSLHHIGSHVSEPDLYRLEAMLVENEKDADGAALAWLSRGMELAQARNGRLQALRCATQMAPLLAARGQADAARACLEQALEGMPTDDGWASVSSARLALSLLPPPIATSGR